MGSSNTASPAPSARRNLRELLRRELSTKSWTNRSGRTLNTQSSHSSHERKESKRTVSFADAECGEGNDMEVNVPFIETCIIHTEPLSEEERYLYYYTSSDVQAFQKDSALTAVMYIKRREANIAWEENEYSIRGLEEMIQKASMKPGEKCRREKHCAKVLAEQERLRTQHLLSPERLRGTSSSSSKSDRAAAIIKAEHDAVFCGYKTDRRAKLVRQFSSIRST